MAQSLVVDLPGHLAPRGSGQHKAAVESWLVNEVAVKEALTWCVSLRQQMTFISEGRYSLVLIHGDTRYTESGIHGRREFSSNRKKKIRSG